MFLFLTITFSFLCYNTNPLFFIYLKNSSLVVVWHSISKMLVGTTLKYCWTNLNFVLNFTHIKLTLMQLIKMPQNLGSPLPYKAVSHSLSFLNTENQIKKYLKAVWIGWNEVIFMKWTNELKVSAKWDLEWWFQLRLISCLIGTTNITAPLISVGCLLIGLLSLGVWM